MLHFSWGVRIAKPPNEANEIPKVPRTPNTAIAMAYARFAAAEGTRASTDLKDR